MMETNHPYPYDFSFVISVFNVESYIQEALDSLIKQDYDNNKVQYILVNDGSTDKSGEICDQFQKMHPAQTIVIHKPNGGLSSARNRGIQEAQGKYTSFFDPDDILSSNTLSSVKAFIDSHDDETDVFAIPIHSFGLRNGPHSLNYKFDQGSRIIDLNTEWDNPQLSLASAFVRTEVAQSVAFNKDLIMSTAEDAHELVKILTVKNTLGIVCGPEYRYRKHAASQVNTAPMKKIAYTDYLKKYGMAAVQYCRSQFGFVPKFIQYMVMYDLQWKLKQSTIPHGVLTDDEKKEYKTVFSDLLRHIDDDVILRQRNISVEHKCLALYLKYHRKATLVRQNNSIWYQFEQDSFDISDLEFHLCFLNIQNEKLTIEGWIPQFVPLSDHVLGLSAKINGKMIDLKLRELPHPSFWLDEVMYKKHAFMLEIPVTKNLDAVRIEWYCRTELGDVPLKNVELDQFFPLDNQYKHAYHCANGWVLQKKESSLIFTRKQTPLVLKEMLFLAELLKEKTPYAKKACVSRPLVSLLRVFKKKQIWLISDRILKADDNGEALFKYICNKHKNDVRAYFVISKDSKDYHRMAQIGNVVDAFSFKHKILHLLCDYNISAQADGVTLNPFRGRNRPYRDLPKPRFVFLQHGVTQNDLSVWLNRYNKNFWGFCVAANPEYESLVNGDYFYSQDRIWKTGFPRFDTRRHSPVRQVTIMPTWRKYLLQQCDPETGKWQASKSFQESDYFKFYNGLLNHPRLLAALEAENYTLAFFPHPNIQPFIHLFSQDERVTFLPYESSYTDVYAASNLVLTDYSSSVFDFAYLRQPILYCQFDADEFFTGDHVCTQGYFDYERDGFGEVTHDLESTVDTIIDYVRNDCKLKDLYRERIDSFFTYHDQNNCQRVYEKILSMDQKADS